jgi:hypothetical protein
LGAKREYVAIFSIGARLLGSFRGAMAAAQSRMRALQHTAMTVGRSILKFGSIFSTLFAGAALFGVGAVFRKIFEGADEAAAAAEQRTRKLTAALFAQNKIRAKGRDYAVAQTKELQAVIAQQSKQGVFSAGMLESAAGILALQKLGPKEIAKTLPLLSDVLVASEGINATQEDMNKLALGFGKGMLTGTLPRSMMKYVGSLTVAEQKSLKAMAKAGDLAGTYKFLTDRMARFGGESARALKTPEGRIKSLDIAMASMRRHIGEASLEARAKLADTWKALLPEIEPFLIAAKNLSAEAMISVAKFVRKYGVPALKAISDWAKGPGAEAWNRMKKAWGDMAGKVGKALGEQFEALAGKGKNLGDVVVSAMDGITGALQWIGDNSSWLVPTLEGLAAALVAISVISFVTVNAGMLSLVGTIGLLAGAFGKSASEYQKFADLMAGKDVSDPEHFTKHWYLMGQTWTETFAGLSAVVQAFQEGWDKSINELKAKWDWLVESIRLFKMPDWWNKFWERQAAEQQKSAVTTGALAEQEAGRVAEAERLAAIQKQWAAHRGPSAAEIAAAQAMAPPFLSGGTAGRGRGPRLPAIALPGAATVAPGVPQPWAGGGRGMPYTAGVQESMAEILPFWKRTQDSLGADWKTTWAQMSGDTAQIKPGLAATGETLKTQILLPIQEIMQNWSLLATSMGTPLAIPTAAAAAATGPGGLPAPDIPADTTGVPGLAGGGVVTRPTLAMVGERGAEAVVPLGRRRGASQTTVNFSPTVTINGNASAAEQAALDKKLRDLSRDFVSDFKRAQNNERRLSYEGGYG